MYLTEEARHKYGEFIKQVEGRILQIFYLSIIIGYTSETDSWTNIRIPSSMFCVKSLGVPYGLFFMVFVFFSFFFIL